MNIEITIQSFTSIILPAIYLFIVSTYIFTRSYHITIGKMVAFTLTFGALAYVFDYIRLLAPVDYNHFIHINIVLFFMSLSFSLVLHMIYKLLQKNKVIRIPFFPYAFYLYPIVMPLYGLAEQFIIGHPGYYRENGWVYRGGNNIVLFNFYFALAMYAINLLLLTLGIKYAKTTKFKHFFKTTMIFTIICIICLLLWHAGLKRLHWITPPTPSLLFLLWSGTFYAIAITKLGFIPSIVKRHSSLLESSPTPIVYLNEKWMITEANLAAIRQFQMKKIIPLRLFSR